MNEDIVLAKTAKGRDEIKTRVNRLNSQLRRILLLVDDKSSIRGLKAKAPIYQNLMDDTLQQLIDDGYVLPIEGAAAETQLVDETDQEELIHTKEALYAVLQQVLGEEQATSLRGKIGDDPKSMYELRTCFDNCVRMVRLTVDEGKADLLVKLGGRLLQ